MGYYADGGGSIIFNKALDEAEVSLLENACEKVWFQCDIIPSALGKQNYYSSIDIWMNDKYHEEDVNWLLDTIKNTAPIESGCVKFSGEDGSNWRFVFRDGEWLEQNGTVIYEDDMDSPQKYQDGFERRTISVRSSVFAPEFEMIIKVPDEYDAEEYIDELLDGILSEESKYNIEWDFTDGLS